MNFDRKALSKMLKEIAKLSTLNGENPFKANAYNKAADFIEQSSLDFVSLAINGELESVEGIGKALAIKIKQFIETGTIELYERLNQDLPEALIEFNRLSGVGAAKARTLFYDLKIQSIDDLIKECEAGNIAKAKGFGPKMQENIKNSALDIISYYHKTVMHKAEDEIQHIAKAILNNNKEAEIYISSDYARAEEIISNIAIYHTGSNSKVIDAFEDEKIVKQNIIELKKGKFFPKVNIIETSKDDIVWQAHSNSCSLEFKSAFFELLESQGCKVNDSGIYKNGEKLNFKTEVEIYNLAGLQYIEPELRNAADAIMFAAQRVLPELIKQSELIGLLHCHTTYSDGANSLKEMAISAKQKGYHYFAVCDHSKSAVYARGMKIEDVEKQHREIDDLNKQGQGIVLLKGVESDILSDGSLDYPDEILRTFDFIVASVHNNFDLDENVQTARIIKAIENPYTSIIGHLTGRLLLKRPSYKLNIDKIIDAAVANKVALEINSNPYRLDCNAEIVFKAKAKGAKFAINPDAHSMQQIDYNKYGTKIARRAWLEKADVINTLPLALFKNQIKR